MKEGPVDTPLKPQKRSIWTPLVLSKCPRPEMLCDYLFNVVSLRLRLSHLLPRQPDGQSQTSGPTHRPLFMHMGSHTPAERGIINQL